MAGSVLDGGESQAQFLLVASGMDVSRSDSALRVHTAAKLNLFLEVLAKREDGFHEIETLMTAITLYDTLIVLPSPSGPIELSCRWAAGTEAADIQRTGRGEGSRLATLPRQGENLVVQAAERLRSGAAVGYGARMHLVKRIPAAAGLGGASSDAAATLVALNRAWQLGWSHSQLADLGRALGSDIPFFLESAWRGTGMGICRGRGERVEPLATQGRLHLVIVRPPEGLSTARVYRHCRPATQPVNAAPLLDALRAGNPRDIGRSLFNRLQSTAEELSPWVRKLRLVFNQLDCLGHHMSGSGTSYFGICRHARQARRLLCLLRAADLGEAFYAETTAAPCHLEPIPA